MKYTKNLIKGNYLEFYQYKKPTNLILKVLFTGLMSLISMCFLGFCISLLPVAVTFDIFRSAYCIELKVSRKLKHFEYDKIHFNVYNWMKRKPELLT